MDVRDWSRSFANTGMKLPVPQRETIFLTIFVITRFLKEQYSMELINALTQHVFKGRNISLYAQYFSTCSR
jgi:hypothetical protein